MNALRTFAIGTAATMLLFACTLTRNLDYLTNGGPDAAIDAPVAVNEGGTTTSSSGATEAGPSIGDIIAPAQYDPANLVQDADNIYWTTDDNKVMKLAKAGGQPQQLAKLTGDANQITQAVVDVAATGNVYLLLDSGVKSVPKAGGNPVDFVATTTGTAIAADDTNVFVLNALTDAAGTAQLVRCPKATPAASVIMSAVGTAPTTMVLTSDSVFWAVSGDGGDLLLQQLSKTAAANTAPTVYKNTAMSGGAAVGIDPTDATEIVIDDTTFYWVDGTDTAYSQARTPATGQSNALLTAKGTATFASLAVDTTNVYLTTTTDTDNTTLIRLPKSGGTPVELTVQTNPTEIIVDDKSIYIAYGGPGQLGTNGGILRITK